MRRKRTSALAGATTAGLLTVLLSLGTGASVVAHAEHEVAGGAAARPSPDGVSEVVGVDGQAFFLAGRVGTRYDAVLWRTDGTARGTRMLDADAVGSNPSHQDLTAVGDRLFFARGETRTKNVEVWTSDGSVAGTSLLRDINPGPGSSTPSRSSNFRDFTRVGEATFFLAYDGTHGTEIWRTDGTEAGTALLADVDPDTRRAGGPLDLTAVGDALFFTGPSPSGSREGAVWTSDGTAAGTRLVADGVGLGYPTAALGARLLWFGAGSDPDGDDRLWTSDGTPAGTGPVDDRTFETFADMTMLGERVAFTNEKLLDHELWLTDGTSSGTVRLDVPGIRIRAFTPELTRLGRHLYFEAVGRNGLLGLWRTDGTVPGTTKVADLGKFRGQDLGEFVVAGRRLFFVEERPGARPQQLWVSNGTRAGTRRVALIGGCCPRLAAVGGQVVYNADADQGRSSYLMISDGTRGGTKRLVAGGV